MQPIPLDSAPPVAVHGLAKRFRGADALRDVTFEVRRGEILGLLGPNGAGKTTTLHMILGLIRPNAGSVRVFGERGLSLLYTSHNMQEVEEVCDRVVFLHLGRVVAEGTPLEISRRVLASDGLDAAALHEVFLKIAREGAA